MHHNRSRGAFQDPLRQRPLMKVFERSSQTLRRHLSPWPTVETGRWKPWWRQRGGQIFSSHVSGPLRDSVKARWGVMGDGRTAVIEMAQASGLALVPFASRNPKHTTTHGTGQLIKLALNRGYRRIIVGMGGSATNDGGAGMAWALGVRLRDKEGRTFATGWGRAGKPGVH